MFLSSRLLSLVFAAKIFQLLHFVAKISHSHCSSTFPLVSEFVSFLSSSPWFSLISMIFIDFSRGFFNFFQLFYGFLRLFHGFLPFFNGVLQFSMFFFDLCMFFIQCSLVFIDCSKVFIDFYIGFIAFSKVSLIFGNTRCANYKL